MKKFNRIWAWCPVKDKKFESPMEIYFTKQQAMEDKWRWTVRVKLIEMEVKEIKEITSNKKP